MNMKTGTRTVAASALVLVSSVTGCDSDCAAPLRELASAEGELRAIPGPVDLDVPFVYQTGSADLDTTYSSPQGAIKLRSLRYWLSNVKFTSATGDEAVVPNSYYLMGIRKVSADKNDRSVDAPRVTERRELVTIEGVTAGHYDNIEFDIGVEPAHNDDLSIPGGELNALGNMAVAGWMWYTSYVFSQTFFELTPPGQEEEEPRLITWENGTNDDLRHVVLRIDGGLEVGRDLHETVHMPMHADLLFVDVTDMKFPSGALYGRIDTTLPQGRATLAENWRKAFLSAVIRR